MNASSPSTLFTPVDVGGRRLKNRLVALPVYTGYAHPGGSVSGLMLDHYARLAASGVAMVVVANAAVSATGILSRYNLRVDQDEFIPGLAKLAHAIHANGAVACLQLNHGGRFANTPRPLLPSAMDTSNLAFNVVSLKNFMNFFPFEKRSGLTRRFITMAGAWSRAMDGSDRQSILEDFANSARRAALAGFDMVELHGAGGYLICQFLSPFSNKDPQRDGLAFVTELVRRIKAHLEPGFPVGFRLIVREWVPGGIDLADALKLAGILEREGLAYLSPSVGTYNSMFSETALTHMAVPGYLKHDMLALGRVTHLPLIISGRITTPGLARQLIAHSDSWLIGLGRTLRTDPRWPAKAVDSRQPVKACINCNSCLKGVILDQGFVCRRWSRYLQEKTGLEHQLLSRNYRGLMVAASAIDLDRLCTALPYILPRSDSTRAAIAPTLLILQPRRPGPKPAAGNHADAMTRSRDAFLAAFRAALDDRGFKESRLVLIECDPREAFDAEVIRQASNGDHGLIIIPRDPAEPWRNKTALGARGKIMVLMGTRHARMSRVLIPVDMSISSLLVLMFFQQAFGWRRDMTPVFVHILDDPSRMMEKRWGRMKRLVGLKKETTLHLIPRRRDVVEDLIDCYRSENLDSIIMGRRGISRIKYLLLGSVSAGMMRRLGEDTIILVD